MADLPEEAAKTLVFVNARLKHNGRPPLTGAIPEDLIDDFVREAKRARAAREAAVSKWEVAASAKAKADMRPLKMAIYKKEPIPYDKVQQDPPGDHTFLYSFSMEDKVIRYTINPTGEFSDHGQAISAAVNAELFLLDSTFRLMFEEPR